MIKIYKIRICNCNYIFNLTFQKFSKSNVFLLQKLYHEYQRYPTLKNCSPEPEERIDPGATKPIRLIKSTDSLGANEKFRICQNVRQCSQLVVRNGIFCLLGRI